MHACLYAYYVSIHPAFRNANAFYNEKVRFVCFLFILLFRFGLTLFVLLYVDRMFTLRYRMLKSFPSRHHKCFIVPVNWKSPLISNDLNYSDTCLSVYSYKCIFCFTLQQFIHLLLVSFWVGIQKLYKATGKKMQLSKKNQQQLNSVSVEFYADEVRGVCRQKLYRPICHISNIPLELTIYAQSVQ